MAFGSVEEAVRTRFFESLESSGNNSLMWFQGYGRQYTVDVL